MGMPRHLPFAGLIAALAATATGCEIQGNCTAACVSEAKLSFVPPITQAGTYSIQLSDEQFPHAFTLPSLESGFQVAELRLGTFNPPRTLHVRISKDGTEVVNSDAKLLQYGEHEVCGARCTNVSFSLATPASLTRSWGPCEQTQLTGTYAINEATSGGGCSKVFTSPTLVLEKGLPQMSGCLSTTSTWSAETCNYRGTTTCSSGDVTWTLSLTDVRGDGSQLLGSAEVDAKAPVACRAVARVELNRQ
jgi:hypothetical protein